MKYFAGIATAVLATSLSLGGPAAASGSAVPSHPVSLTLNAKITSNAWRQVVGQYDGVLRLQIAPSGVILGTYQPNSGTGFDAVNGGLEPNGSVWLEIGSYGQIHITGTYANGHIEGIASGPGVTQLTFNATPKS